MALLDAMPGDPSRPQAQADAWRRERADAAVVHDTLRALVLAEHADLAALADQAVTHWLAWPKTYGLDTVIVPALRLLAERPALMDRPASRRLRAAALAHLQARVSLDLAPPADWRREVRMNCRCEHCQGLGRFLRSADQEVWRFKAREADRRHVEDSIRQGRLDVDCTTERKGSPHVLVCSKNQASYERRVAQRRADLDDLQRLKAWPVRPAAHRGEMPWSSHHRRAIASMPPLEGEPGLALRRVRGQRVLEATEGLALLQRLPELPGEAVIAALIDEVLHDAEGLRLTRCGSTDSRVVDRRRILRPSFVDGSSPAIDHGHGIQPLDSMFSQ